MEDNLLGEKGEKTRDWQLRDSNHRHLNPGSLTAATITTVPQATTCPHDQLPVSFPFFSPSRYSYTLTHHQHTCFYNTTCTVPIMI